MLNPIEKLKENWQKAIDLSDPNAFYGHLATVTKDNHPRTRLCHIREISDDAIVIFLSKHSPKWTELNHNPNFEISIFWSSLSIQYRFRGTVEPLSHVEMSEHWLKKPYRSKLLDYYYREARAQSSIIPNRQTLEGELEQLAKKYPDDDSLPFIESSLGIAFNIHELEEWTGSFEDRLHYRKLYCKEATGWSERVLVP